MSDTIIPAPAPTDLSTITILIEGAAIPQTFQVKQVAEPKE
jgi:hypothetical protein